MLVTLVVVDDVETDVDVVMVVFVDGALTLVDEGVKSSGWAATISSKSALTTVATPTGSLGDSIAEIGSLDVVPNEDVVLEVEVVRKSFLLHDSSSGWML